MRWFWQEKQPEKRIGASIDTVPWSSFADTFGVDFPLFFDTGVIGNKETIGRDFLAYVNGAFQSNPIVFACVMNRMLLFSEARFLYRELIDGRPGDYFSDDELLKPLRYPWPGGCTGDLLALAEVDVSCAGNFFAARRPSLDSTATYLKRLRPDWVTIVLGSQQDPEVDAFDVDAEVIGYIYNPNLSAADPDDLTFLGPTEVCHYMPVPDPSAPFRGMSWITPVLQDLMADKEMTGHKRKFLNAGGVPPLAIKLNVDKTEEFDAWVQKHTEAREGASGNPYKTLFLAAAADPIPLGGNTLNEADFSKVQGAGEVRIAAAAKVHPAYAGFIEGLHGSALGRGNLTEINRQFADTLMRPLWRNFANSMQVIIGTPNAESQLWYDDRDIPALQQDETDKAGVMQVQAATIASLIQAGFDPETVVEAVNANDLTRLEHTGLVSVQLLPPGTEKNPNTSQIQKDLPPEDYVGNGSGPAELVPPTP